MGQKVNPIGLRLALNKNWSSRWYAAKACFGDWLHEDLKIRTYIKKEHGQAGISRIIIERYSSNVRITINAARPGLLIGKKVGDRFHKGAEIFGGLILIAIGLKILIEHLFL